MSDKKKPDQTKPDDTSADNSHVEKQAGLSASINISSPLEAPSNKSAATEKTSEHTQGKAQNKVKAAASDNKSETTPSSNNNSNKSTIPLKNATSTTVNKSTTNGTITPSDKSTAADTKQGKNKISKIAVVALIIGLLAIAASAGHYYWSEQQKAQYSLQLNDSVKRQLVENQQQVAQQISRNKQSIDQQFSQSKQASANEINTLRKSLAQRDNLEKTNRETIAQLQQKIASLGKNQPSDWLLQEAEYLIRVASRSLWLEKETATAISLLNDADLRIQELNDPQFLALRQIIQQDIAKLQSLPKLATDNVILKLMTLDQQVKQLPLAIFEIPEISKNKSTLELTDNAGDWRENLTKTWRKFTAEFFTVTRRTGNIEPLMSPQFQQNLRENLSLKLQTAIWAASKANNNIYLQSLNDIQGWLNDYFDMTTLENQNFIKTIDSLKSAKINVVYPNKLAALKTIRQLLSDNTQPITSHLKNVNSIEETPKTSEDEPTSTEQGEDL
jgi:uroporphyrin-3 C-methyltransferase